MHVTLFFSSCLLLYDVQKKHTHIPANNGIENFFPIQKELNNKKGTVMRQNNIDHLPNPLNVTGDSIHLAYVAMNSQENLRTAINAVIFNRQVPSLHRLHIWVILGNFEIIRDAQLQDLLSWYKVANPYTCIQIHVLKKGDDLLGMVRVFTEKTKFKSTHYSGKFAIAKLFVPYLLPAYVDRVIVCDVDLLFMKDIVHLWTTPEIAYIKERPIREHRNQLIGVTCQQNAEAIRIICPTTKDLQRCHPTRYCNTGLIVFRNVHHIRTNDGVFGLSWQQFLVQETSKLVEMHPGTFFTVADQDIINFLLASYDDQLFSYIPCIWNCNSNINHAKLLHNGCTNQTCATLHAIKPANTMKISLQEGSFLRFFWAAYASIHINLLRSNNANVKC